MSKLQLLPSVDIQHDALAVFDDVGQGVVEEEDIWVSCYKEGQSSVHGKVKLKRTGEGLQGVSLQARDGIRTARKTHRTFDVGADALSLGSILVRFPRNMADPPVNEDSKAPLDFNVIDVSPDGSQIAYGGPDGYCYVQDTIDPQAGQPRAKPLKLKGHVGDVLDVKWFPSGEVVLTASSDATIRIFSSKTGINPRTLTGHKRAVTSTAILGVGRNIVSGSKDGSIKLWDVGAGKCISTLHNKSFVGVEAIAVGSGARMLRDSIRQERSGAIGGKTTTALEEADFEPRTLAGESAEDTADKLVFAGLSSGSGSLAVFDLASKEPIIETFPHVPLSASVSDDRRGGAIHAVAYDPETKLLASASANGIIVVRDVSTMTASGDSKNMRIFSRNQAIVNDLAFVKTDNGVDLIVAPSSGLPFRASLSALDASVKVLEDLAGWDAVPVNSVAIGAGEGNIWVAGGEGGLMQY